MDFGLHKEQYVKLPDVTFVAKQPVRVENTPLCKSADQATMEKLVTGTYFIAHPRLTRGFVRVCASKADVDRRNVAGYVPVDKLLKLNKELKDNNA